MESSLLRRNIFSSLIYQITAIVSGFIFPYLILHYYGSNVNGIVNSISQFLSIIAFLELGIGAVIQTALYKPLATKNYIEISRIYRSSQIFFRNLAKILVVYIIILLGIFFYIKNENFSFVYIATLILSMGINSFSQYYFGIVNSLLLSADRKNYIQYNVQTITLLLSIVITIFLVINRSSIQLIQLLISLIYMLRPLYFYFYVKNYYSLSKEIELTYEPIKQKWNGVAQHVSAIVLDSTDKIILTFFSTLDSVSIYSIYYLVVAGVKQVFHILSSSIQSTLGNIYVSQEKEQLILFFKKIMWSFHTLIVFIMGIILFTISPFVLIYTKGITDAQYYQPCFGYVLVLAYAIYCLRLPYHMMIKVSGHYKETQCYYIISAIINVILSILVVKTWGIIGVAVGTLISMLFQTVFLAKYTVVKIINCNFAIFYKQLCVDFISFVVGFVILPYLKIELVSYIDFFIFVIKSVVIWILIVFFVNVFFYFDNIKNLKRYINMSHVREYDRRL